MNQAHLTNAPAGGKLVAWHTSLDLAAYVMADKSEVLMINGKQHASFDHPSQYVIFVCRMTPKAAAKWLAPFNVK
jgi:hypothetical protein